jgi:uncharacterized membrane protein
MSAAARSALVRSALTGAATGGRTFTGLAALTLTAPGGPAGQPDRTLQKTWVKGLITAAAVQELVMDKLPNTPSRLEPPGLALRAVAAATAGAVVARREADRVGAARPTGPVLVMSPVVPEPAEPDAVPFEATTAGALACVLVAAAAAVGTSFLGNRFRSALSARLGTDYVGAGVEDALTVAIAWLGARPE